MDCIIIALQSNTQQYILVALPSTVSVFTEKVTADSRSFSRQIRATPSFSFTVYDGRSNETCATAEVRVKVKNFL